jgi:predicted enzyme related to lactoylglutathione lyase
VFGWSIRHRDGAHPSFDDATGDVSGSFTSGRQISPEPGLLPYISVDSVDATLNRAAAEGGVVVEAPHPDSPGSACWIATFRDPEGNLMGLYQEGPR